ncbi:hypothetical protein LINPERHAP2_LOCUS33754 [Linum perenne]
MDFLAMKEVEEVESAWAKVAEAKAESVEVEEEDMAEAVSASVELGCLVEEAGWAVEATVDESAMKLN